MFMIFASFNKYSSITMMPIKVFLVVFLILLKANFYEPHEVEREEGPAVTSVNIIFSIKVKI